MRERTEQSVNLRRRVFVAVQPYHRLIVAASVVMGSSAGFAIVPALLIRKALDDALPLGRRGLIVLVVVAVVAVQFVIAALRIARRYLTGVIAQRVINDVRVAMYRSIRQQGVRFFGAVHPEELIERVTARAAEIEPVIFGNLATIATSALLAVSALFALLVVSPVVALLTVVTVPFALYLTRKLELAGVESSGPERYGALPGLLHETLGFSGAMLAKTFGRDSYEEYRFADESKQLMQSSIFRNLERKGVRILAELSWISVPVLGWLVGGLRATADHPAAGTIVAATVLQIQVLAAASALLWGTLRFDSSLKLFEELFAIIDLPPEIKERKDPVALERPQGRVSFEHVSFGYKPQSLVLNDVSFEIPPGRVLALVGPSGSGRKTIGHLLTRLYDPWEGSIQLDGHDLRDCSLQSLAVSIGVISKDVHLMSGSIRENLLYANHDASEAQLSEAAKIAGIYETIISFPSGFDSVVGEAGARLSEDELQRLGVAQALLKNPAVMLIDESWISNDVKGNQFVERALRELRKGRTCLIVAHRSSTLLEADQILVLDRGRIVERGTHTELLSQRGLYARLFKEQFAAEPKIADVIA